MNSSSNFNRKKILVFASGQGSNFQSLHRACRSGELDADIISLITDRENCGAIRLAQDFQIPFTVASPKKFETQQLWAQFLVTKIGELNPDLTLLLGFLKKVPSEVIQKLNGKLINTHPSLLPKFGGPGMYGSKVHDAVLKSKETATGITLHWVSEEYDKGEIIAQTKVAVESGDTALSLANRLKERENRFLIETLKDVLKNV